MNAYDYKAQKWENGVAGARVRLAQLQQKIEIVRSPRGADYMRTVLNFTGSAAACIVRLQEQAAECEAEIAQSTKSAKPNAAILFSPLRVVPVAGAYYEVRTKQDDTPGSRNNFCLVSCENENEAQLFSAAPELLSAAENAENLLKELFRRVKVGAETELCRDALAPLRNAITKAKAVKS